MQANKIINTGLIGFGFSAQTFHLPFLTQDNGFAVTAVSSSKPEQVKEKLPQAQVYASAKALITDSNVELIVITAPNDVHFELAKLALEHNKHVVIEKPFVTNSAQGQSLIELAEKQQKVLTVYHNRRWDGDFLTVKKLIEQQTLGDIKYFESHFDRFRPVVRDRWREQASEGGGILFDLGPHLIDQCLSLFGWPDKITAICEKTRAKSNNIDYFSITLHYAGMLANLQASLHCAGPNLRYKVQGDKANYEKFGLDPQEDRLKAGATPSCAQWAAETEKSYGILYKDDSSAQFPTELGGYQAFFQQLNLAISENAQPPVDAADALKSIKIIELAMQSSLEQKTIKI
ncbi:oxidoreductase [Catenovulum sp. SX2]|uniref:oxidoreductase n=1 Tax=Catenovulum sp. SX2 TaxID=3398614 RepID=UPI003F8411C7